ncbi:MAG: putative toxin-antitoxin system toxin component, PIN family [Deltaproteobacteria bacterium]|nr:putative toxin-antitoxin system toxin component, PIN family [Deltaproteobacteria bacterium]
MDTGVLISAFAFDGIPEKAVRKAFADTDIYVSPAILMEYRHVPLVLEADEKLTSFQLKAMISGIAAFVSVATMVYPLRQIRICRDVKDNMLLECCLEARANILITGDKDLLSINKLPFDLKILTPKEFLEE